MNDLEKMAASISFIFDSIDYLVNRGVMIFGQFSLTETIEMDIEFSYNNLSQKSGIYADTAIESGLVMALDKVAYEGFKPQLKDRQTLFLVHDIEIYKSDSIAGIKMIKRYTHIEGRNDLVVFEHPQAAKEWDIKLFTPFAGATYFHSDISVGNYVVESADIEMIGDKLTVDIANFESRFLFSHAKNAVEILYSELFSNINLNDPYIAHLPQEIKDKMN